MLKRVRRLDESDSNSTHSIDDDCLEQKEKKDLGRNKIVSNYR